MEKYDLREVSDIVNSEREITTKYLEGLDAIKDASESFMSLSVKDVLDEIKFRTANRATVLDFPKQASEEENNDTYSKLSQSINAGESAANSINKIKEELLKFEFKGEKDSLASSKLVEQLDNAANDLNRELELGKGKLSNTEVKSIDLDNAPIVVDKKEDLDIVNNEESNDKNDLNIEVFNNEQEEKNDETFDKVENVEPNTFNFEDFNIDDLNKSVDEEVNSSENNEEFHNQDVITDSIEEDKKDEDKQENFNDLANLFNTDEIDKALEDVNNDKNELKDAQDELDGLLQFPTLEENASFPVIENDEDINLGDVHNDYKVDPAKLAEDGYIHVDKVEDALLNQDVEEEKKYSRVA